MRRATAAFEYFKNEIQPSDDFDAAAFETACGVGVVVTPEQIADTVKGVLEANKAEVRVCGCVILGRVVLC